MADRTMNQSNRTATALDKSFNETPKTISKGTIIMLLATILFIIIASVLIGVFLTSPTGNETGSFINSAEMRVNL